MSTLKRRLDSIEERLVLQQHRDLQRQFRAGRRRAVLLRHSRVLARERRRHASAGNGVHGARDQDGRKHPMGRQGSAKWVAKSTETRKAGKSRLHC